MSVTHAATAEWLDGICVWQARIAARLCAYTSSMARRSSGATTVSARQIVLFIAATNAVE
jgi:hypothetical protein